MNWSKEAEQSVLGACMLDELAFEQVSAKGLTPQDFHLPAHRMIFESIVTVANAGHGIDVVTVAEHLDDIEKLEDVGGAGYLSRMVDMTPSIDNVEGYAAIVKQRCRSRQLTTLGDTIIQMVSEGDAVESVQEYAGQALMDIATSGTENRVHEAPDALRLTLERLDGLFNSEVSDWSTGLAALDEYIRPEESRIYAVIGDTGSGKTTLAQTIAEGSLKQQIPVYYASMEMPVEHMMNRFISSAGSVNRGFLKNPKAYRDSDSEWPKLSAGTMVIKGDPERNKPGYPLTLDCTPSQNITALSSKVRAWARKQRSQREEQRAMLVVDYLGLMDMPGRDLVNELGEISKALKVLTNDLGICTIMLAQVNRGVATREDKKPRKSDIRDSGKVENDMDAVIGVYRAEYYMTEDQRQNCQFPGTAELIISKSRDERLGEVRVKAELQYSRFTDLQSTYEYQG